MNTPFPFALKYRSKTPLKRFNSDHQETIKMILEEETVDITACTESEVTFDVGLFRFVSRWNVMHLIDKGEVRVTNENGRLEMAYEVRMVRFFIFFLVLFLLIFFVSQQSHHFNWVFGIAPLFYWVIAYFRHKHFFKKLQAQVEGFAEF